MSNCQADWLIFERKRLGLTRKALSDRLSVADKTIQRWEADTPIPSDKLSVMIGLGFDVLYILTGQRSEIGLSKNENKIIEKYRHADIEVREEVLMLLMDSTSSKATKNVVNDLKNTRKNTENSDTTHGVDNPVLSSKSKTKVKAEKIGNNIMEGGKLKIENMEF